MATAEKLPFSWHSVESLPDLERLRLVLETLPDREIVAALEAGRGRGRNDYPVRSMWRALIAGVVFQHASIQSLLRELGRNPALLEICGFDPLPFQSAPVTKLREGSEGASVVMHPAQVRSTVPSHWNISRFLTCVVRLEKERGLVSAMVESLRASLFEEVPDFGRHLGYDGKAIESHSTGRVAEDKGKTSDPDADWGKHETTGVHGKTGEIWKTVKSWFGYGLHLIADTHHELPVAFEVTRASDSEVKMLPKMLETLFAKAPEMADRCDDFSADRGLDNAPQKKQLWDKWTIRPLVDTRLMWKAEKEEPNYDPTKPITRALFPNRADVVVHDERGRVSCVCPQTGEVRAMAFQGFEADRGPCGTLKYRLPGGGLRLRLRGQQGVPPGGRGGARRVRPHRAHRSRQERPAHLHPYAVGQPVLAAWVQSALCDRTDQQPPRQQLQLRDPLHPRARQDEDPCRAGPGGDDGAGRRPGAGRPRGADALAGRCGAVPRHRLTVCLTSDIAARSSRLPAEGKPRPSV